MSPLWGKLTPDLERPTTHIRLQIDTPSFSSFLLLNFWPLCSMWDLSSPTRDQTLTLLIRSRESPWNVREVPGPPLLIGDFFVLQTWGKNPSLPLSPFCDWLPPRPPSFPVSHTSASKRKCAKIKRKTVEPITNMSLYRVSVHARWKFFTKLEAENWN